MQEKKKRCPWCLATPEYIEYHDLEWGTPTHDDRRHFEFLILESAQAGLSWLTVLRKRKAYQQAFANYNPRSVAALTEIDIQALLNNSGIIRNRQKIVAAVNNAKRFLEIQAEWGSFDSYIWSFTNNTVIKNAWDTLSQIPARTELSDKVSTDLKKRGFTFVGSTIMYAHLQAVGIVNDHLTTCFRY